MSTDTTKPSPFAAAKKHIYALIERAADRVTPALNAQHLTQAAANAANALATISELERRAFEEGMFPKGTTDDGPTGMTPASYKSGAEGADSLPIAGSEREVLEILAGMPSYDVVAANVTIHLGGKFDTDIPAAKVTLEAGIMTVTADVNVLLSKKPDA